MILYEDNFDWTLSHARKKGLGSRLICTYTQLSYSVGHKLIMNKGTYPCYTVTISDIQGMSKCMHTVKNAMRGDDLYVCMQYSIETLAAWVNLRFN